MEISEFILVLPLITTVLLLNGHMSIASRNISFGRNQPAVYPGTFYDILFFPSPFSPLTLTGLPFSFVANTLMFPIDICHETDRNLNPPQKIALKEKQFKTGDVCLTNRVSHNFHSNSIKFVEQGNKYYAKALPDYAQVFHLYSQAAELDDAASPFNLGNVYYPGRGVPVNDEMAYTWYLKSANSTDNHDSSPSNLNIVNIHYNGLYLKQDYQQATEWYMKATKCRHPDDHRKTYCESALQEKISLGNIYYNGAEVTKDLKTAFDWHTLAQHLNLQMVPQKGKVQKTLSRDELKEAANKLAKKYGLAYGGAIFTDSKIRANYQYR